MPACLISALPVLAGYLMGSIPFGLLLASAKNVDPRRVGSGNIGATNVLRAAGKLPALLTLLADGLKGAAAVGLARLAGLDPFWQGIAGLAAVVGHCLPVFLKFKGGKGVATGLGVICAYAPLMGVAGLAIWILTAAVSRYSSLSALSAFALMPVAGFLLGAGKAKILIVIVLFAFILWTHRGNVRRLLGGTERKIGEREKTA
ncbi:MAG: glycerol-3-phosphate 1-O-acyltransferase PlsY [Actinomycetota bacterium]|nr:glycerol-3-phosphate 1-O-acyltransferase PlsY [Actinomycetota bacterium]